MLTVPLLLAAAPRARGVEMVKYPGEKSYIFRFTLKDKKGCGYSLSKPTEFLSEKAIGRRERQGIAVDSTDLPVSGAYIKRLLADDNVRMVGSSKWNNTVLIACADTACIRRLRRLSFVVACYRVWESPDSIEPKHKRQDIHSGFNSWDSIPGQLYGKANDQLDAIGGIALHAAGYRGEGVTIAVLDGGFANVDRCEAFRGVRIEGWRDFVFPRSRDIFNETDHGTKVLSAMAVYAPEVYIGSAPAATYWLLRCEDQQTEQPVEEDYWAMAAEFADSVGADIINSSVGYNEYDDHYGDHYYHEMDGNTTLISHTASMLATKGIILVNSAGNSGMGPWKKMTFPGDAHNALTIGAVTPMLDNAPFNGVGPTQDGRIKPDLMAIGSPACLVSARGTVVEDIGTSFACPLVCGMIACLWEALPQMTAIEIIELARRCGNNYDHPDNIFGYGIPDFMKALRMGKEDNDE